MADDERIPMYNEFLRASDPDWDDEEAAKAWGEAMSDGLGGLISRNLIVIDQKAERQTQPLLSDFMHLTPEGRTKYLHILNVIVRDCPDEVRTGPPDEESWVVMNRVVNWITERGLGPEGLDFYMTYGLLVWGGQVDSEEQARATMKDGWRNKFSRTREQIRVEDGIAPHPLSLLQMPPRS